MNKVPYHEVHCVQLSPSGTAGVYSVKCVHSVGQCSVVAACGSEVKSISFDRAREAWVSENVQFAPSFIPRGSDVIALDVICPKRHDGVQQPVLVLVLVVPPATLSASPPADANASRVAPGRIPTSYQSKNAANASVGIPDRNDQQHSFYLHVFGGKAADAVEGNVVPITSVARDYETHAQIMHLDFVPYMLTHTSLAVRAGDDHMNLSDIALVLLGDDDARVHAYRREFGDFIPCKEWKVKDNDKNKDNAERFQDHVLPQPVSGSDLDLLYDMLTAGMQSLPSEPVAIDIKRLDDMRIVSVGCSCGHVRVASTPLPVPYSTDSVVDNELGFRVTPSNTFSCHVDGPISSLKLFSRQTVKKTSSNHTHLLESLAPDATNLYAFDSSGNGDGDGDNTCHVKSEADCSCEEVDCNLLVCSASGPAIVFSDIQQSPSDSQKSGPTKLQVLPESGDHDAILCCCVADLDFDGQNELIIGTYGQKLIVYKYSKDDSMYVKHWDRVFSLPIVSIDTLDVFSDGVRCLVVATQRAVHFLQPDMKIVSSILHS